MPTFSAFARNIFRAGLREAQDVLADCTDVNLIHLESSKGFEFREKCLKKLVHVVPKLALANPGLKPVRLGRDYELLILVCPLMHDVLNVNAIQGWRDRCRTAICWIDELWACNVPRLRNLAPVLSKFDHVIVGIQGSGRALGDAIGCSWYEVQGGVDALRFSPYPNPPKRVIDVYSIGRREPGIHLALLKLAVHHDMFYVHDTLIDPGDTGAASYSEHRDMYARIAKRSRFFMVAPGKMDSQEETKGQVAPGLRYFEGVASGAVLVGQIPDCEAFRKHFDWPQAVVEIQPDGSDTAEVIARLSAEPEQLHEISCRNAEKALRRHDWVYRWREILGIAGLRPTPGMEAREKRLGELAELIARQIKK